MTSYSPRLPVGRQARTGPHRRRKPVPKYDTIDWDNPGSPVTLGVDTDYSCSRAFRCTTLQVERRRREYFIPAPPHREEQGRWPDDNELRRQNILSGQRQMQEAWHRVRTNPGSWPDMGLGLDSED
jgi:hypothetical protein